MKKKMRILLFAVIGLVMLSINPVMAQSQKGERPSRETVDVLTDTEIKTVNDILSKYDSNSLTEDDAKAIMKSLKESKIPRGKGVDNAIADAGFNAEELRKLARPEQRRQK